MDNMEIENHLRSWGLAQYTEIFEMNNITLNTLCFLDNDLTKKLIAPVGDRARFLSNLAHWKRVTGTDDEPSTSKAVSSFTSLTDTLNTLFWALFCMAPLESADVVLENTRTTVGKDNKHAFTERVGYFCFGCFEVISVIVVLNMLIATMSNTFQRVTNNVAIEWTFGRTQVYVDFMSQTTLPSPYNMVPTAAGVSHLFEWIRTKFGKSDGARARWSSDHCCYIDRDIESSLQKEYPALMSVLLQRYFRNKYEKQDQEKQGDSMKHPNTKT